jgi:protein phosphatase methylesterase 1
MRLRRQSFKYEVVTVCYTDEFCTSVVFFDKVASTTEYQATFLSRRIRTSCNKMQDRPRAGLPPPLPRSLERVRRAENIALGMNSMRSELPSLPENASSPSTDTSATDLEEDTTPRKWNEVFDEKIYVRVGDDDFCVYLAGMANEPSTVCVMLHGGGHCALSWGLVAENLKKNCGVLAYDARGHGESKCKDERDLSAQVQVADAAAVVQGAFAHRGQGMPDLVICGHSMGGAIAIRLAASGLLSPSLKGMVIIDVVEGTAMTALPHMRDWVRRRTSSFQDVESGVRYVIRAGHIRNAASARLSVPMQLAYGAADKRWTWRTELEDTAVFWRGWFEGLSQMFLSVPVPKLLVLAGVDRLDKDLMIAQMQGKFQNMLIPGAGHVVHEDRPGQTANVIIEYLRRNLLIDNVSSEEQPKIFQQRAPVPS